MLANAARRFPAPASALLSQIGKLSKTAEAQARMALSCYPSVLALNEAPSGARLSEPIHMMLEGRHDQIAQSLFMNGWAHETDAMLLFEHAIAMARPGIVLDVGANTGLYTLLAAALSDREITALEPLPQVHDFCADNLRINPRAADVKLMQIAASNTTGQASLFLPNYGHSYIETSASLNPSVLIGRLDETIVPTSRLDDLFNQEIAIIKIDVEGFEEQVISGALAIANRYRPIFFSEILPQNNALGKIQALLNQVGYIRSAIDERHLHLERNEDRLTLSRDYLLYHVDDTPLINAIAEKAFTNPEVAKRRS